jgi:hypothetical protein
MAVMMEALPQRRPRLETLKRFFPPVHWTLLFT